MSPIDTFHANHQIVCALNERGARYIVVGGAATIYYVPERPTEHGGELDLLIERSESNAEKVIAALASIGYTHPEYTVERLTGPKWVRLPVDNGYFYADILTPEGGEHFEEHWNGAADETIGNMPVRVISIEGQIERLTRSPHEKHKQIKPASVAAVAVEHRGDAQVERLGSAVGVGRGEGIDVARAGPASRPRTSPRTTSWPPSPSLHR